MKFLAAICLAILVAGSGAALAQNAALQERDVAINAVDQELEILHRQIDSDGVDDVDAVEERIRELLGQSRARLGPVTWALEEVEQSLSQLGPAPAEGDPAESEPLATRRSSLRDRVSVLQGQRTRVLANIDEAGAILTTISAQSLANLYGKMFERGRALFSPSLIMDGANAAGDLASKVGAYFDDWGQSRRGSGGALAPVLILLAAFAASFFMIGPVHRWMRRTFTRRLEKREPSPGRRVAVAGVKMLARLVPGLIGGAIIIEASRATGLLQEQGVAVAQTIWFSLVAFLVVEGFTSGLFSPAAPNWRIAAIEASKGRKASRLLLAIVGVFGAKAIATAIAETAGADSSLGYLIDGVGAVLVGALLILLCRRSLWSAALTTGDAPKEKKADDGEPSGFWLFVRRAVRIIGAAIILGAVAGYVRFADFAASRFYFLALILAVAWFLRAAIKETAVWAERRLRSKDADEADEDEANTQKEFVRFWIGAGIDFLLFFALAPLVLILVGVGWRAVRDMVWRAFLGFRVGGVSISFADIFLAFGIFFVLLALTRFIQGALQRGPFAHSRLDAGVQNSLTTLLGYVGLLIAIIAGVTSLGFDLSNLAIIAGALSVGIGFGLQSIVNNFVSGLILLFERPIKVGDWILTTSGEGTVKKISVRSTEIETFDRSSIIIPNSELISQSVTNWTHKNKLGRVTVPVGVSYNADPEQVKQILLEVAKAHPLIVRYPEPFVVWQDFGASSLDFEVRGYLANILDGLTVRTELRFAIFNALKEAGIEIPFPQSDLHIKSVPPGEKQDEAPAETEKPAENPIPQEPDTGEDD